MLQLKLVKLAGLRILQGSPTLNLKPRKAPPKPSVLNQIQSPGAAWDTGYKTLENLLASMSRKSSTTR